MEGPKRRAACAIANDINKNSSLSSDLARRYTKSILTPTGPGKILQGDFYNMQGGPTHCIAESHCVSGIAGKSRVAKGPDQGSRIGERAIRDAVRHDPRRGDRHVSAVRPPAPSGPDGLQCRGASSHVRQQFLDIQYHERVSAFLPAGARVLVGLMGAIVTVLP
jgi:hypothetical protein